jgi:hypothetical protein
MEAQPMEQAEAPAVFRLLRDNTQFDGAIAGLSLEGCRFRTAEPFGVGVHIRVEVEFQICGLPFRLAGVIEDVPEKHIVVIRFLEMSFRKRKELAEAIQELQESGEKQSEAPECEVL